MKGECKEYERNMKGLCCWQPMTGRAAIGRTRDWLRAFLALFLVASCCSYCARAPRAQESVCAREPVADSPLRCILPRLTDTVFTLTRHWRECSYILPSLSMARRGHLQRHNFLALARQERSAVGRWGPDHLACPSRAGSGWHQRRSPSESGSRAPSCLIYA